MKITQGRAINALLAHLHAHGQREFEMSKEWLLDMAQDELNITVIYHPERDSLIVRLSKPYEVARLIEDAEFEILPTDQRLLPP